MIAPFNLLKAQSFFNVTIPYISSDSMTRTEGYNAILETPGTGYLAFGNSWNFGAGIVNCIFDKVDQYGNLISQVAYGDSINFSNPIDAHYLPDSLIGVLLDKANTVNDSSFFHFCIVNTNGDTLKNFFYSSGYEISHPRKFILTSDGGYAMIGHSRVSQNDRSWSFILKTDSLGAVEWMKNFGDTTVYNVGTSLIELQDGYLALSWVSEASTNTYKRDVKLTKLNLLGNILWERVYGVPGVFDLIEQIIKNNDNSFSLIGTRAMGPGQVDNPEAWYLEIDSLGNIIRDKHCGGIFYDELNHFIKVGNMFYCSGSHQEQTSGFNMGYLLALNQFGDSLWSRYYVYDSTSNFDNYFWNLAASSYGGVILCGQSTPGRSGTQDAWLVKVDSNGCVDTSCAMTVSVSDQLKFSKQNCSIYPNPSSGFSCLKIGEEFLHLETTVTIYNVNGKVLDNESQIFDRNGYLIPLKKVEPGIYLVTIKSGLRSETIKWVVL